MRRISAPFFANILRDDGVRVKTTQKKNRRFPRKNAKKPPFSRQNRRKNDGFALFVLLRRFELERNRGRVGFANAGLKNRDRVRLRRDDRVARFVSLR